MSNKKKMKFPIKKVLSNNMFVLKLVHQTSPGFLGISVVVAMLQTCVRFISDTLLLRYALNGINEGKTFEQIAFWVLVWMVLRVSLTALFSLYHQRIYPTRLHDVKQKLHTVVYEKAAEVELGCYENPLYYDKFVKAIDECAVRAEDVIHTFVDMAYICVGFMINFGLLVLIDPVLLAFALIPLLVTPLQTRANKLRYQREMERKEENRRKDYVRRTFYLADYAKEMRLTNMPELMLREFETSGNKIIKIIKEYALSLEPLVYMSTIVSETLAPLGATFYAAWRTLVSKTMGYGDFLVVTNAINVITYTVQDSAGFLLKSQENALYIENLKEFLAYEPTLKGGVEHVPGNGDLVLKDVSFRYDGADKDTLHHLNMHFGAKEKVAIVGHNGAGKTTLVKLLLRLYDAEGSITYGGKDIKQFPIGEYRDIFASVMQDYHIFALTTAENVLLERCCAQDEEKVLSALEKSGLSQKLQSFSQGIHTMMTREFDENGEQLSGGEQQKLAISHVYAKENRFVILDEPSSALDPIAEYEMYERMRNACEDCGMIFISHRLSSAVMADRIYLMENGMVLEEGSHAELMEKNGKYAEMFRRQASNYAEVDE